MRIARGHMRLAEVKRDYMRHMRLAEVAWGHMRLRSYETSIGHMRLFN